MWRGHRHSAQSRFVRTISFLIGGIFILDLLSISWVYSHQRASFLGSQFSLPPITERVFVASTHWNNEWILRTRWNAALLELVQHVGISNIYVSIYESGSYDDSKGALTDLDAELDQLGVARMIVLDETTHADEIAKPPGQTGWIETPRHRKELRRIPYLAGLRNLSLKPLEELASRGIIFDKILYLNDVVYTVRSSLTVSSDLLLYFHCPYCSGQFDGRPKLNNHVPPGG